MLTVAMRGLSLQARPGGLEYFQVDSRSWRYRAQVPQQPYGALHERIQSVPVDKIAQPG